MKMYVANCTQQVQDFTYRLPGHPAPRQQKIEIGGQTQISGDLGPKIIEAIINQHSKYGMVAADEVDRARGFISLCYSVDTWVRPEKIRMALNHNNGVLINEGKKIREESAVAVNNAISDQTPGLKSLEMSVEEQETKSNPDPKINEGVRVSKDEEPTNRSGRRGRPRRNVN